MRVGDLVTYKRAKKSKRLKMKIGVVVGKCPVKTYGNYILIQWTYGERFLEHRKYLKLVKK